ncbi:ABC transporter permease [Streptomyces inhibens]|uniref:ABC transporter permease n=1 Tax=Streptomyces inhibens TaxID=2293571 RepID=UPI00402ADA4A
MYARTHLTLLFRDPNLLAPLAVLPLYCVVFFTVLRHHHHEELATQTAIGAFLMSMWAHAVFVAAEVVDDDRHEGTLEPSMLTPGAYTAALSVRVFSTTALAIPVLAEALLIARFAFGFPVTLGSVPLSLVTVVLTTVGVAGAALLVSCLMVLVRGARTLQNALTYPVYLLGGLILPASTLPEPLRWIARGFFLSWSADVLRALQVAGAPAPLGSLGVLTVLVVAQVLLGFLALRRVLTTVRAGGVSLYD